MPSHQVISETEKKSENSIYVCKTVALININDGIQYT